MSSLEEWWKRNSYMPVSYTVGVEVTYEDIQAGYIITDVSELNPFSTRMIIVYETRKPQGVRVIGTITTEELMHRQGYIQFNELGKNTSFEYAPPPAEALLLIDPPSQDEWFLLPMWTPQHFASLPDVGYSDVVAYIDAIAHNEWKRYISLPCTNKDRLRELALSVAVLMATNAIQDNDLRVSVKNVIDEFERKILFTRLRRYYPSETDCLRLLAKNSIVTDLQVTPTMLDLQIFHMAYPFYTEVPFFFGVPMEELPEVISSRLPLHKGGMVHITFMDFPEWYWYKHWLFYRDVSTQAMAHAPDPRFEEWADHITQIFKARPQKRVRRVDNGPVQAVAFTGDIEDLVDNMAPCMKQLIRRGRFPKDDTRIAMTRILYRGQVPLDVTGAIYKRLNDNDPNGEDLLRRYNFTYTYKANYGPVSCELIHAGKTGTLTCPFKAPQNAPLDACKEQCYASFMEKHPEKVNYDDPRYFSGPHKWFLWTRR